LIDKVELDEFSKEDERLAGILAAQLGRVYQNGSLYADVLRHASDLERRWPLASGRNRLLPGGCGKACRSAKWE
jgi:hypothetical protein